MTNELTFYVKNGTVCLFVIFICSFALVTVHFPWKPEYSGVSQDFVDKLILKHHVITHSSCQKNFLGPFRIKELHHRLFISMVQIFGG